jgi:cation diffusion facilitator family transporter
MKTYQYIIISLVMIFISFFIRVIGFLLDKNIAVELEAIHIVVDIFITLFILVTLQIISSNYSKKFSYGLFKVEDLISFLLAIIVALTGIELFYTGILSKPYFSFISGIFQGISVIPLFFAGYFKIIAGKKMKSPSLVYDGKHTYTDVYEGLGVSVGLILTGVFNNPFFYYASVTIALIALIYTSYSIGKESTLSLLDLPKDRNMKKKIENAVYSILEVKEVKETRMRWAGPVLFVELVIEMDPRLTIEDAHPITENIEEKVKNSIEGVYSVTVHVEPIKRKNLKVLVPVTDKNEKAYISDKLVKSPYFCVINLDGDNIVQISFLGNTIDTSEDLAGIDFKEYLMNNKITDIVCTDVGEITYGLMLSYGIYCWHSSKDSLENIVNLMRNNQLKKIRHPTKNSSRKTKV